MAEGVVGGVEQAISIPKEELVKKAKEAGLLNSLPKSQQVVLGARYLDSNKTLEQIGKEDLGGRTRQRVQDIEERGINNLVKLQRGEGINRGRRKSMQAREAIEALARDGKKSREIKDTLGEKVSIGLIETVLKEMGLQNPVGRPKKTPAIENISGKRSGRPEKKIDLGLLKVLTEKEGMSAREISPIMDVSPSTIFHRRVKEKMSVTPRRPRKVQQGQSS